MLIRVSEIISQLTSHYAGKPWCVLSIMELNWNQRFRDRMSRKLENLSSPLFVDTTATLRSFHVVERKRAMKCTKINKKRQAHVQRVQNFVPFVNVKYANLCCLVSCFRSLQFRENVVSLKINTNKQAFPRTYGRGTWGFAVLRCWWFFWWGDAVNKISICGDLKSYGVRCLRFSHCGVRWYEIICGAVVSCKIPQT